VLQCVLQRVLQRVLHCVAVCCNIVVQRHQDIESCRKTNKKTKRIKSGDTCVYEVCCSVCCSEFQCVAVCVYEVVVEVLGTDEDACTAMWSALHTGCHASS